MNLLQQHPQSLVVLVNGVAGFLQPYEANLHFFPTKHYVGPHQTSGQAIHRH